MGMEQTLASYFLSFLSLMQVTEVHGEDVVCVVKNSATLAGSLFTLHVSQIHIDLPTLTDNDKKVLLFSSKKIWHKKQDAKCYKKAKENFY